MPSQIYNICKAFGIFGFWRFILKLFWKSKPLNEPTSFYLHGLYSFQEISYQVTSVAFAKRYSCSKAFLTLTDNSASYVK